MTICKPDARVEGPTARPEGRAVTRFTVSKGGQGVDVLAVSRDMANGLYRHRDGGLVFTDAALLEYPDGALRLETDRAENTLYTLPAGLLEGKLERLENVGGLGVYRAPVAPRPVPLEVAHTAPCRWTVALPAGAMDGLKDLRLQIDYTGDIGMLFLDGELIADNFCNGDTWEVGLRERLTGEAATLTLAIAPLRAGARVNADSPMAARSEHADARTAALHAIRAVGVYEVLI